MPMLVKTTRRLAVAPIDHPLARQIESLPAVADIRSIFRAFHGALGAEGYRLGIKYLDAGIHIPRGSLTGRKLKNTKDPIHVLFPKFRPVPHPTDPDCPKPPISPEDAASCLAGMQEQQRRFVLFEIKDDPLNLAYHASNVYVTPLDSRYYFLSIDDVKTEEKRARLTELGIRPALVTVSSIDPKTGEENQQWTLKIPKLPQFRQGLNLIDHFAQHLPKPVDDPAIRALAQRLNLLAGDPDVTSCTRDFRLPGFYQLKEKYISKGIYHIVTIKHAEDVICPVAEGMYHESHAELEKTAARRVRPVGRRPDQHSLPVDASATPDARPAPRPTGATAPVRAEPDFYPENPIYMAHAAEVQALDPADPKLAPGRSQSKFRVLQRLIVTGSLEDIDQGTDLFKDAQRYLKDRERANLYVYLRTENAIDAYRDALPTQGASFHAHYSNAQAYFQGHGKSARAAARRMFYMQHSRSVIERTMAEAGIPPADAAAWAKEGCAPTNQQIRADARYFEIWERCERSAVAPDLSPDCVRRERDGNGAGLPLPAARRAIAGPEFWGRIGKPKK